MQARRNWRRCLKVVRLARLGCPRLVFASNETHVRCSVLPGYGITALVELNETSLMKAPYNIDCHIHYRVVPGVEPYVGAHLSVAQALGQGFSIALLTSMRMLSCCWRRTVCALVLTTCSALRAHMPVSYHHLLALHRTRDHVVTCT